MLADARGPEPSAVRPAEPSAVRPAEPLPLTGERTAPGIWHESYWFQRHVAAYRFAARRFRGRRVLDAGSGEGYGTAMLAANARSAIGVELVPEVVAHARAAYPEVEFLDADLCALPLGDDRFDGITSFQVIEHLPDVPRYLAETARVLAPGGELLCSTPNRLTFTPGSDTPVNPFHVTEFAPDELVDRLCGRGPFRLRALLGLHHARRLRTVERLLGRPLPDRLLEQSPDEWPWWLRRVVEAVRPIDFTWRVDRLDEALDLLAIVSVRP